MPRPKSTAAVTTLDQQIAALTQTIHARFLELRGELDTLADQYQRITGKALTAARVNNSQQSAAPTSTPAAASSLTTMTKSGKKRSRKLGVDFSWIQGHLSSEPLTLRQLQQMAESESRSGLSVMNVLRANKSKFKTIEGIKKKGVKGKPPQLYSTK